jgi:hypothetical protein
MPDDQLVSRHSTKPTVKAAQDLVLTSLLHINLMLSLLQSTEGQRERATLYAKVKDFSLSLPFAPLSFFLLRNHPSAQIKPPPKAFFRLECCRKPLISGRRLYLRKSEFPFYATFCKDAWALCASLFSCLILLMRADPFTSKRSSF